MLIVIKLLALKTFIFRKLNICVEKWSFRFLLRGKKIENMLGIFFDSLELLF